MPPVTGTGTGPAAGAVPAGPNAAPAAAAPAPVPAAGAVPAAPAGPVPAVGSAPVASPAIAPDAVPAPAPALAGDDPAGPAAGVAGPTAGGASGTTRSSNSQRAARGSGSSRRTGRPANTTVREPAPGVAGDLVLPGPSDPLWASTPLGLRQNLAMPAYQLVNPARGHLATPAGRKLKSAISAAARVKLTGAHWLVLLTADRTAFGGPTSQRAGQVYKALEQLVTDYLRPALDAVAAAEFAAGAEPAQAAPAGRRRTRLGPGDRPPPGRRRVRYPRRRGEAGRRRVRPRRDHARRTHRPADRHARRPGHAAPRPGPGRRRHPPGHLNAPTTQRR